MGSPVNVMVGGGIRGGYGGAVVSDQQSSGYAPMSEYQQTPSVASGSTVGVGASGSIIDGTPVRVATLVALAIFGLAGLKWAGFKFNVTVG